METCIVYIRKSTNVAGKQENSIEIQRDFANNFLKKNSSVQVLDIEGKKSEIPQECYIEEKHTAKEGGKKRPKFKKMLDLISKKGCDYLVIYQPSRISRNREDTAQFMSLIEGGKIRKQIITSLGNYDVTNSIQRQNLEKQLMNSKFENDDKSEQSKAYARHFQGKGFFVSRIPFGYKSIGKGKIDIVPGEARLVRKAFEDFLKGKSGAQIHRDIVSEGHSYSDSAVYEMLRNIFYSGYMKVKDESGNIEKIVAVTNEGYKPIIEYSLYERVQEKLQESDEKEEKKVSEGERRYNLHNIAYDTEGRTLQGYTSSKKGELKEIIYYRNRNKSNSTLNITEKIILKKTNSVFNRFSFSEEFLIVLKFLLKNRLKNLTKEANRTRNITIGKIDKINEEIQNQSLTLHLLNGIAQERIIQSINQKGEQIKKLEGELIEMDNTMIHTDEIAQKYTRLLKNLHYSFSRASYSEKANILRGLNIKIIVDESKKIDVQIPSITQKFLVKKPKEIGIKKKQ